MRLYKNLEPVVSVILPSYNRKKLLERAINSVINQTIKEWELIIVDDGSSDKTFDLVKSYQNQFENIRYLRHSNRKLPLSLNVGIQASCGKYLTFLGSDDEFTKDHLRQRVEFLRNNPEVDLLHGGVEVIGDPYVKDKNDLSKKIHLNECVIGGTFFGKRDLFNIENGFKDVAYSEDSEFFERIKDKYIIRKVSFPTYRYYRDTPDSICSNIT
ncbi:MAG: glycosyltransferase [Melioribacteraceae bacterium]|nr:glycosyltransferase [Melioribacteraceae bacterium]MDD3557191.1 glycosyltransferase [Melioribacteraceae bacterium]